MAMQVATLLLSLISYTSVKKHFTDPKWECFLGGNGNVLK